MDYYELPKEKQKEIEGAGVDCDLRACLEYNPQSFDIFDIEKVVAVFEGERDEEHWRWVIKLTPQAAKKNGGRFAYLEGGCDYTGWDCQSSANSNFASTALKAAEYAKDGADWKDKTFLLGVYTKLVEQIKASKSKTWRERKDAELGVSDLPKL